MNESRNESGYVFLHDAINPCPPAPYPDYAKLERSLYIIFPIIFLLTTFLTVDFLLYRKRKRHRRKAQTIRHNWDILHVHAIDRMNSFRSANSFRKMRSAYSSCESLHADADKSNRANQPAYDPAPESPFAKWAAHYDGTNYCDICALEKARSCSMRHVSKSSNDVSVASSMTDIRHAGNNNDDDITGDNSLLESILEPVPFRQRQVSA